MQRNASYTLFLLLLLSSFASVSAVLFTPALPSISSYLDVTTPKAQQSISIFLVGYALGNLPWGPIANRYGRKKAVEIGIILSCIGMLICLLIYFFPSLWILNLGRLITALGASVGIKIAFTYISDLYAKEVAAKKISYLMLSFAIAPGLAIAVGGVLTKHLGWFSCLIANLCYGVAIYLLCLKLPETLHDKDITAIRIKTVFTGYMAKLKNPILIKASFLMGCATTFIYLFASLAPFIAIKTIGLSSEQYGLYSFIPPVGMIVGFYATQLLHGKMSPLCQIKTGAFISSIFSFLFFVLFYSEKINAITLFFPIPALYIGLSLIFANASALALSSATNKSNASAMTNFLNMSLCVVLLFVAEALPLPSTTLLSSFFIILSLMMWILSFLLEREKSVL